MAKQTRYPRWENVEPAVIRKGVPSTPTELYLNNLCDHSFLSLWSYPRVFRDQGGGKELSDGLVVFGNDIIILSDKHCELYPRSTLETDWRRWFKRAVATSAKQAWGAERWLREHPSRTFLDPECTRPFPLAIPSSDIASYHVLVVVHGVAQASRAVLGGSGSLVLRSDIRGIVQHTEPFVVGDLDPSRTFVHVLDDTTLDVVLRTLDTTPDLLQYLRAKEELLRSSTTVAAAGEEELLAIYLKTTDRSGNHAFDFDGHDLIALEEGFWQDFSTSPQRQSQIEHDDVSYTWDRLIEQFAMHALNGTQYTSTSPSLKSSEAILRVMASEGRLRRRMLSLALLEAMKKSTANQRLLRVAVPQHSDQPLYVFLLFPWRSDRPYEENRRIRGKYLEACVRVAKVENPSCLDIIGIATESGRTTGGGSEDAIYLDARNWTSEEDEEARRLQREHGILEQPVMHTAPFHEYPLTTRDGDLLVRPPKNPRNKPCPCGSGRKYKKCHGLGQ